MNYYEACMLRPGQPLIVQETVWDSTMDRLVQHNVNGTFYKVLGQHVVVQILHMCITLTPEEIEKP